MDAEREAWEEEVSARGVELINAMAVGLVPSPTEERLLGEAIRAALAGKETGYRMRPAELVAALEGDAGLSGYRAELARYFVEGDRPEPLVSEVISGAVFGTELEAGLRYVNGRGIGAELLEAMLEAARTAALTGERVVLDLELAAAGGGEDRG